jgi:outer membrane receptor protein involved in Fe transport
MCGRTGIILLAISAAILPLAASPASAASPDAAGAAAGATASATAGAAAGAAVKARFDLPAESLDKALRDFALQAKCNISYEPSLVAGLRAPAINGEFTVDRVLSILLKSTRLRAVNINEDTIQILEKPPAASHGTDPPIPATQPSDPRETSSPGADAAGRSRDLDEITVTGTHIRGTKDSPSPVQVFTRADIDATGMLTVQQFLQTLPQNFGGASENTIGSIAARSRTNNTVNGSAPNLRGIGAEATLVLINGHRVAPGNGDGSFVDISMIPLSAIERIEVVTDGASAIYGSDAVGGVVNIILRSKFDGAESRALFGAVGTGSMHNVQAAQTVGNDWTTGSAVLSYQYSDQTPLSAGSRDYLHSVLLPFNLLPEQVQHAAFAAVDQEVRSGFDLHGDATYSHRSSSSVFSQNGGAYGDFFTAAPDRIDAYGASLGATVALPLQSKLAITAVYSESDTSQQDFETPSDAPLVSTIKTKSTLASLEANVDGIALALPAGQVHYAIGAQFRRETFGNSYFFPPTDNTFYPTRDVTGGYAELRIPLLGPNGGSRGDPAVELTAADRAEHYSDFGSTNNPQVGLIWKPISRLALRSTYGTSFKAPLLSDLNPIPAQVVPFPGAIFNPAPGGTPNTLIVDGGNPNLKPEKATVWTVGLDLKPIDGAGFSAKLTYYDIVFKDEILSFASSISVLDAFVDEALLGPHIVQRNPSASLVQQLISYPSYVNPFNVDPTTIGALLDERSLNLSTVKTRGLDFGTGYKTSVLGSTLDAGIDGTYIFAFDNQFSSTAPVASFLNTPYNPIDVRLRGRAIVTQGPWSTGLYMNFTNAYQDTNVVPKGHVSSWTTVDAVAGYQFGSAAPASRGLSVALSVTNLTNRAPPYVSSPSAYPITFDGVNANPLGRFFSLRLQKRW